jgi:glycolate oxidase FAD binding subunit
MIEGSSIQISAQDQTLTASADTLLLELYEALPERLHLPFPPVELPGGLGSLIERGGFAQTFFFGSEVLGLSFVAPSGRRVVAGGRTVKNVQGYDLTRPFVGSFGQLGKADTVTLRLRPGLSVAHHSRPGTLEDLPPEFLEGRALEGRGPRFVWQDGAVVHAYHFGHLREVQAVMAAFGGSAFPGPALDYRPYFLAGMGVAGMGVESGTVRDRRFDWVNGTGTPPMPELFEKLAASL